jgi:hypothetical protein
MTYEIMLGLIARFIPVPKEKELTKEEIEKLRKKEQMKEKKRKSKGELKFELNE